MASDCLPITTQRLLLRQLTMNDFDSIYGLSQQSKTGDWFPRWDMGEIRARKFLGWQIGKEGTTMNLTHSCIITQNIERLQTFYADVLHIEPQAYGEDYVEFPTGCGTLSPYSLSTHDRLAPGSARAASNRSVELEFQVDDVDREYVRLQHMDIEWIKPPTTQSWGGRSVYFRDPDGNLINFYSRVGSE